MHGRDVTIGNAIAKADQHNLTVGRQWLEGVLIVGAPLVALLSATR